MKSIVSERPCPACEQPREFRNTWGDDPGGDPTPSWSPCRNPECPSREGS